MSAADCLGDVLAESAVQQVVHSELEVVRQVGKLAWCMCMCNLCFSVTFALVFACGCVCQDASRPCLSACVRVCVRKYHVLLCLVVSSEVEVVVE